MKTNNTDKEIGLAIRKARKELKLTQKDLGDYLEVSENVISNYEKGITPVPASKLGTLALIFGVPVQEILGIKFTDKSDHEEFMDLLDTFDSDNIYKRYYYLPLRSRQLVNKVISHEMEYVNQEQKKKKNKEIYLAAASGTKGMNDEELEKVNLDIQNILDEDD